MRTPMSKADCAPAVPAMAAISATTPVPHNFDRRREAPQKEAILMGWDSAYGCLIVIVTRAVCPAGLSFPVPADGSSNGVVLAGPPPNDAAPGIDGFNPSAIDVAPPGVFAVNVVVVVPDAALPSDVPLSAVSTLAVLTA